MEMKKIVVFGGGTGLSQLLKGLKLFPFEITAVVTVADNGKSTGKLRKELDIPAVGDISKVLLSMANKPEDIIDLMNYRFTKSKSLENHSIKNLLLTALLDITGNFDTAIPIFCDLLDIEGTILPLTEDSVDLVGITKSGKEIVGEEQVTKSKDKIVELKYSNHYVINKKIYDAIDDADLIIFASGSLFTSIIPNIIDKKLCNYLTNSDVNKLYVCNLFTQPGETDGFKVSDHIKLIEKYLGENDIDAVIANNKIIGGRLSSKYLADEQKDFVTLDKEELERMHKKVIEDNLIIVENNYYRHDALKTAYLIYAYLMELEKNDI